MAISVFILLSASCIFDHFRKRGQPTQVTLVRDRIMKFSLDLADK